MSRYKDNKKYGTVINYKGTSSSTLTWGIGANLRLFGDVALHAAFESTGKAVIDHHSYSISGQPLTLPPDYDEPQFTFNPTSTFYIGIGAGFHWVPTLESLRENARHRREERQAKLLATIIDSNIPAEYKGFADEVGRGLIAQPFSSMLSVKKNGVSWLSEENILLVRLQSNAGYLRDDSFMAWRGTADTIPDVYAELDKSVIAPTVKLLENAAKERKSPAHIVLAVDFYSYTLEPTRQVQKIISAYPLVIGTETTGGGQIEYQYYAAIVRLTADQAIPAGLRVDNQYTQVLSESEGELPIAP